MEDDDDDAFFDYLEARQCALQAAAGYFAVANVPTDRLEQIVAHTTDPTVGLAAKVTLHQRRLNETTSERCRNSTGSPAGANACIPRTTPT